MNAVLPLSLEAGLSIGIVAILIATATVVASLFAVCCCGCCCCCGRVVPESKMVVLERCGKFTRALKTPGLHFVAPWESARGVRWFLPQQPTAHQSWLATPPPVTMYELPTNEVTLDIVTQHVNDANGVELLLDPCLHIHITNVQRAVYATDNLYAKIEQVAVGLYRQAVSTMTYDELSRGAVHVNMRIADVVRKGLDACRETYGVELKMQIQDIWPASEQMQAYLTQASAARMERQQAQAQLDAAAHRGALVAAEYRAMTSGGMSSSHITAFAELERARALGRLCAGYAVTAGGGCGSGLGGLASDVAHAAHGAHGGGGGGESKSSTTSRQQQLLPLAQMVLASQHQPSSSGSSRSFTSSSTAAAAASSLGSGSTEDAPTTPTVVASAVSTLRPRTSGAIGLSVRKQADLDATNNAAAGGRSSASAPAPAGKPIKEGKRS